MNITDFKSGEKIDDFDLTMISCCDESDLTLIKNERSDASYKYLIICTNCKQIKGTIRWNNEIKLKN
jgi:hypothetical protein